MPHHSTAGAIRLARTCATPGRTARCGTGRRSVARRVRRERTLGAWKTTPGSSAVTSRSSPARRRAWAARSRASSRAPGISLVIDARGADALAQARARARRSSCRSSRSPATSPTARTSTRWSRPRNGASAASIWSSTTRRRIGRSPLPRARPAVAVGVRPHLHDQRLRAAAPDPARAAGACAATAAARSSTSAPTPRSKRTKAGAATAPRRPRSSTCRACSRSSSTAAASSVIVADPGDMDTELHRAAVPDADASRLADPRDVAPALLRAIASPRAAYMRVALQSCRDRRRRVTAAVSFALPPANEATTTPERRGLARDGVRLLVTDRAKRTQHDAAFRELPWFLRRGDLLVVNDSATLPAALVARRAGGATFALHLSTHDRRRAVDRRTARAGRRAANALALAGRRQRDVSRARRPRRTRACGTRRCSSRDSRSTRFWRGTARPIRYRYVRRRRSPLGDYQTIFARVPGSAEMPSAGRPFSPRVARRAARRRRRGRDAHAARRRVEPGAPRAPATASGSRCRPTTAAAVNATRLRGGRVIAVGTTVVRALETRGRRGGEAIAAERLDRADRHAGARRRAWSTAC